MKPRAACLLAVILVLTAVSRGVTSTSSMPHPAGDVDILVAGAPLPRVAHDGRWYVEALHGREYAIRLRNPYPVRVAIALSVDGLNTIDARQTSAAAARKWVLGPFETVTISGWQTSRTEARRFEFTTESRSYGHALGKTDNLGVITAVFFKERTPAIPITSHDYAGGAAAAVPPAAPAEREAAVARRSHERTDDEYAATGMGRPTGHVVTRVWLDLEDSPAHTVNIRYEFREQLTRLGILPGSTTDDRLLRRERAHGFEPGFCPEPRRKR